MAFETAFNPPHGTAANNFGLPPGFEKEKPDTGDQYLIHMRQGAIAGLIYAAWGVGDAYIPASIDFTLNEAHGVAIFRALLVFGPTALLFFRRGMVSALGLASLAALNIASLVMANQNGDPDVGALSFVLHLPFAALFVRAAWAARQWKKQNGGRS